MTCYNFPKETHTHTSFQEGNEVSLPEVGVDMKMMLRLFVGAVTCLSLSQTTTLTFEKPPFLFVRSFTALLDCIQRVYCVNKLSFFQFVHVGAVVAFLLSTLVRYAILFELCDNGNDVRLVRQSNVSVCRLQR